MARPVFHLGQHARHPPVLGLDIPTCLLHAVQAQVARAPLEQGGPQRHAQGPEQAWQVARIELVLQGLGGGGHQHALAAEQGRHQVGKGLAHARAGFGHEHAPLGDGARHGLGQGSLAGTRVEMRIRTGQGPLWRERLRHGGYKSGHAASCVTMDSLARQAAGREDRGAREGAGKERRLAKMRQAAR